MNWGNGFARWMGYQTARKAKAAENNNDDDVDVDDDTVDPLIAAWEEQQRQGKVLTIDDDGYSKSLYIIVLFFSYSRFNRLSHSVHSFSIQTSTVTTNTNTYSTPRLHTLRLLALQEWRKYVSG